MNQPSRNDIAKYFDKIRDELVTPSKEEQAKKEVTKGAANRNVASIERSKKTESKSRQNPIFKLDGRKSDRGFTFIPH